MEGGIYRLYLSTVYIYFFLVIPIFLIKGSKGLNQEFSLKSFYKALEKALQTAAVLSIPAFHTGPDFTGNQSMEITCCLMK